MLFHLDAFDFLYFSSHKYDNLFIVIFWHAIFSTCIEHARSCNLQFNVQAGWCWHVHGRNRAQSGCLWTNVWNGIPQWKTSSFGNFWIVIAALCLNSFGNLSSSSGNFRIVIALLCLNFSSNTSFTCIDACILKIKNMVLQKKPLHNWVSKPACYKCNHLWISWYKWEHETD